MHTQTYTGHKCLSKFTQCRRQNVSHFHYNDVIINAMASQITNPTIVYSSVYSLFRRKTKKTSKLRVTGLCWGWFSGDRWISRIRASNAENVSIWWRHHVFFGPKMLRMYWFRIVIRYARVVPVYLGVYPCVIYDSFFFFTLYFEFSEITHPVSVFGTLNK